MNRQYKIAILTAQPIADQTPLFQKINEHPNLDLTVYFSWKKGVNKAEEIGEFGVVTKWDIPLLEGYNYSFLKNFSIKPSSRFFGQINPGIIWELFKNNYDALIVYGYSHLTKWLAIFGCWITKTPLVIAGEMVLRPERSWINKSLKFFGMKIFFCKAQAFLSIGSFSEIFFRHYGVEKESIFFAPFGANNELLIKKSKLLKNKRRSLRNNLNISLDDIVLLFVGAIIKRKRPLDLLKAYENLVKSQLPKVNNIHLIYVGSGSEEKNLKRYKDKHSLSNVHFIGFKNQTELPKYYAISDIFILPSQKEVSPIVMSEAMCFSLPLIVSDKIPSSVDLVINSKNGFIFPAGNIKKLSVYIKKLLNNPKKIKEFGEKSLEIIKHRDYNKHIEGILKALNFIHEKK